jgi:hypothetical protein
MAVDLWSPDLRTETALRAAVESLRAEHGDPVQPMAMYEVAGTDPRSSLGRAVELDRFADSFDNEPELLRELYGAFEPSGQTDFLIVVDHERGRPAGAIRCVTSSADLGCPMLNDLQATGENGWGLGWDEIVRRSDFAAERPEEFIDIATLAVSREYAGSHRADGVSKALFAAVLQHAIRSDATTWVTLLDRIPYLLVQAWGMGVMREFEGVEPRPYHGAEDTTPLWCNFRPYEAQLAIDHPEQHARLMHNLELDDYFFGWADERVIDLREPLAAPEQATVDITTSEAQPATRR